MTTDATNDAIWAWAQLNFPNESRVSITLGIGEECGELQRAVLKQYSGIRGTYEEWDEEIKKEIGDVYIKLGQLAGFCNWDLNDLIADRWDTIKRRNWIKDPIGHGIPKDNVTRGQQMVASAEDPPRMTPPNYDYETEGLGGT